MSIVGQEPMLYLADYACLHQQIDWFIGAIPDLASCKILFMFILLTTAPFRRAKATPAGKLLLHAPEAWFSAGTG